MSTPDTKKRSALPDSAFGLPDPLPGLPCAGRDGAFDPGRGIRAEQSTCFSRVTHG